MTKVAFVIPGDLGLPTGGYAYDRRVLALLPELGIDVTHVALPGTYPSPSAGDLATTRAVLAVTAADTILLIDGLAYGAMPADLVAGLKRSIVALVHHPLCLEAGLTGTRQRELKALETAALVLASHVIVTSPTTGRTLTADFDIPAERITVAEPGTDPAPRAKGSRGEGGGKPLRLLAVGSVVPRKGYDVLVEALAPLKALDWRLDIAGALDRSSTTARDLARQIDALGYADRISLLGAVDDAQLAGLYDRADLFVMASHYEGFGMVLTEAVARGLPIVMTAAGAAAETVPDAAALKVEPGQPRALAWVLGRAIEDAKIRQRVADAAWTVAQTLPRWDDTARRIADALKDLKR